jgi:preprotein translocase subunit SecG
MMGLLTGVHVLIALILILIVLLQSAKGTDVGSAFGGMGSQAAFGPRGTATFLSKATVGLAVAFMVTSVALSIMGRESTAGGESILSNEETTPAQTAPAPETPGAPAAAPTAAPAGSQNVQVNIPGVGPVPATITVDNPDSSSDATAPAQTTEPNSGSATPGSPPSASQ